MKPSWLAASIDLHITARSYLELQKPKNYILLKGKYLKIWIWTSSLTKLLGGYWGKNPTPTLYFFSFSSVVLHLSESVNIHSARIWRKKGEVRKTKNICMMNRWNKTGPVHSAHLIGLLWKYIWILIKQNSLCNSA